MPSGRARTRTGAGVVLLLSWGSGLWSVVLMATAEVPWTSDRWYCVVDTTDALVYGLVAAVVLNRRANAAGWLVALTAVGGGTAAVTAGLAVRLGVHEPLPGWAVLQATAWVPGTLALATVVPYLVSARRPVPPAVRAALAAGVAVTAALLAVRLANPGARLAEPVLRGLMAAVLVLGLTAAGHAAYRRYRDPSARGLGWLAIGTALISLAFLPLAVGSDGDGLLLGLFTPLTHLASQAFFPAAVLVAVLRQRLWGIDLAVSRTLVWSLLTGLLVTGYVALAALLGVLLPTAGPVGPTLATAVTAAGFQPARTWLQRRVDRLVHGEEAAPVLSRVGRHLGSAATPEETLAGIARSVAAAFNLGSAGILDPEGRPLATEGGPADPRDDRLAVPLTVRQRTAGTLLVTSRPGERFDRRTRAALDEVAPVVATAVHLAAVTRALRESRGRLAAARDDERRVLRRELHDQLGPALAGIGLGVAAARNLLPEGAERADALLGALRLEVDARVEEVRQLARGLVPPVLTELGLVPALRELVMRYEADGLAVSVREQDVPEVRPAVAGAVYAIVAEAVLNVARHAAARSCVVSLRGGVVEPRGGGLLTVSVEDDGLGIAAGARPGVGTQSLRERAEEIGGTVEWHPGGAGTGTRLVLSVPVEEAARHAD
ncbi:histidine kinase [Kitasatospora sp. NPDC001664]